jgi:hypothetical protein
LYGYSCFDKGEDFSVVTAGAIATVTILRQQLIQALPEHRSVRYYKHSYFKEYRILFGNVQIANNSSTPDKRGISHHKLPIEHDLTLDSTDCIDLDEES